MDFHKILVVGVGSIGERHVRCFQHTGRATVSIVEPNEALRRTIAERYRTDRDYGSLSEALQTPWNGAIICTPANTHLPIAIECARRGIHLLIEKPLSVDGTGLDELTRLTDQQRLTAAVAYVLRSHPVLAAMRDAIRSGRFGKPVQLVASSGQHFPTYRPAYREIYYANRATGGGAIQDALTHVINAGEWLVGPMTRVTADADHLVLEGVTVEDTVHVLARHGHVMGSYSLNQHQAPNELTITVVCEQGTVRFESHRCRYRWMTEPGGEWHDESSPPLERDTLFTAQAACFLDAIAGAPPRCSLQEGAQTWCVNRAILASAESGSWVSVEAGSQ